MRFIKVTQGMGLVLDLVVKRFKPHPDDQDTYTWSADGYQQQWKMPPFAVADIDRAQKSVEYYVDTNIHKYIEKSVSRNQVIPWHSFQMAAKMSQSGGVCIPVCCPPLQLFTFCSSIPSFETPCVCLLLAESSKSPGVL